MKGFFRSIALLTLALVALTPARAQQAAPAPQAQAAVEKVPLYVSVKATDEDKIGSAFANALLAKLQTVDSINVITSDPTVDAPTATVFHILTVKSGDSSVVAIVVLRHTKGFPTAVYVGAALLPTTADTQSDDVDAYFAFLGEVFTNVQLSNEFDQQGTPPAAKQ